MQISAPETQGAVRPYVKLNDIGDTVVLSIAHVDKSVPERDYDTNEIKRWDDGNPVTQTRIVGIVHTTSGNPVGRMSGDAVPLEAGDEVAIFVSGGKHGNQGMYKAAESEAGGVQLCDMLQFKFDRTEPANNPKYNDRKIYTSAIRRAKPEEMTAYKAECERIWHDFQNAPTLSEPDGAQAVADSFGGDVMSQEDPF